VAPPPPWRFIGRISDGDEVQALLATPQALRVVRENETLDADWRVQRIGDQAVELLWLPSAQPVRLPWVAS
jgi:Tfp pilus assembly protein PilP